MVTASKPGPCPFCRNDQIFGSVVEMPRIKPSTQNHVPNRKFEALGKQLSDLSNSINVAKSRVGGFCQYLELDQRKAGLCQVAIRNLCKRSLHDPIEHEAPFAEGIKPPHWSNCHNLRWQTHPAIHS
jgi:hypothetical protein